MKFNTIDEFEAWLRDYSKPFGSRQDFLKDAVLSKDPIISKNERFIMEDNTIYVINRVNQDPIHYYITYTKDGKSDKMWWTMVSKLYERNMEVKEFQGFGHIGWSSMNSAKIWILTEDKFESFINWRKDPFEVKS